jgi:hypothetical protein
MAIGGMGLPPADDPRLDMATNKPTEEIELDRLNASGSRTGMYLRG